MGHDVIWLTKELVSIGSDSTNEGEKEVAKFITSYLKDAGIAAQLIEFAPKRASVIAQIGSGEGLLLNGHIDTVPIGDVRNWAYGTAPTIHNGKLYGRGTSDMKGGVAGIMAALSKLSSQRPKRRVLATFVAGEETESEGSINLLTKHRKLFSGVKYGIVGEPTHLKLQIAQKGVAGMKVRFRGRAAHGSKPWLGDSAITKASRFISEYLKIAQEFPVSDKLLGRGTANIGKISGGTAMNVVPDACVIEIDRRIVPGETPDVAVQQVKTLLKKLKISADVELLFGRAAFKLNQDSKIIAIVKNGLGKIPPFMGSTGYTEAELYKAEANIDSVVFGPGLKKIIHKANEYVPVSDLTKYDTMLGKIINRWLF
jgi:acetylornithine deacetylase/succinyl-diaminopimelate desuccinylase family protein